jgi:excisionase family DNA binding protein
MPDPPLTQPEQFIEKLLSIKEAAKQLGIPYWKLNRAVQLGLIPSYSVLNTRKLVRLSEIINAIRN